MTADLGPAATPRPVPSPEDRMADARTDTPTAFRTYLDASEAHQLDARAATAEQERDEALQDRDEARQTAKDLYGTLKTIERERDEALATARRYAKNGAKALMAHNAAEAERDEATEDRDQLRAENANLTAGLRTERVKTGRLEGDLRSQTQAVRELTAERDEARAELRHVGQVLTDWRSAFTEEPDHEADRVLVDLIDAGLVPTAASSVPPRRAQGPRPGQFCTEHFSWLCQAGQGRCQGKREG